MRNNETIARVVLAARVHESRERGEYKRPGRITMGPTAYYNLDMELRAAAGIPPDKRELTFMMFWGVPVERAGKKGWWKHEG